MSQPSPELIRTQIDKIAASGPFHGSARLRELLQFTVTQAIDGHGAELKESVLGVEVFGRKPGYDSEASSIVRVEFARLRKKLAEYYGLEGSSDPVRIEYLKGTYAPEFRWRAEAATSYSHSLAVLPFSHTGSSPDDEYFADGLTDELITALSGVPRLKVVARTSAFAFKGRLEDIREIGHILRVDAVLEGSVRRHRDLLRIHAQLVDVNDGCHLWAQKYERRLTDLFAVQDEIAAAIADALKVELPRVRLNRCPPRSVNLEAHQLYIKGRYWWHRWNPEALRRALAYFKESIDLDPTYAPAYSGLADCYLLLGFWGHRRPSELMPRALGAARRAVELDETLAEAHSSLAMIENAWHWNSERCEAEFHRSLELNPNSVMALAKYATSCLAPMARFEESFEYLNRALDLDPLSPNIHADLALNFAHRGLHDRFEQEAAKVLEMDPDIMKVRLYLITMRGLRGDWDGAVAAAESASKIVPDDPSILCTSAWGFRRAGR